MTGNKKNVKPAPENMTAAGNQFSKEQLLIAERFRDRRDLVDALLDDGELYTVKSVEEKIEKYMKGRVR